MPFDPYGNPRFPVMPPMPAPRPTPVDELPGPRLRSGDPLKPGRYKLELDVTVERDGGIVTVRSGGRLLHDLPFGAAILRGALRSGLAAGTAKRREIEWRPGDVVVVRYGPGSQGYTFVRGALDWPGDKGPAKTDDEISSRYAEGLVRPVLQQGGEPFDPARLP